MGALALYFPVCGALLSSLFGVALDCLLGGRVRSSPVDGLRLRQPAFPCSVAFASLKNRRSHAAWRSFCVLRPARHPLTAGLGRCRREWQNQCIFITFSNNRVPMQRGAQIARRLLCVTCAPVLVFPIYGASVVIIVLHIWRSRALFSDSPWPPLQFLQVLFFSCGRSGALFSSMRCSPFFTFWRRLGLPTGWSGPVGPG